MIFEFAKIRFFLDSTKLFVFAVGEIYWFEFC